MLRNNLASASDIVRLLVLYQQGGIYIDVATPPGPDDLFICKSIYLAAKVELQNRLNPIPDISNETQKALSIILQTLDKRYRYLENSNALFHRTGEHEDTSDLSHLLHWQG